MLLFCTLVYKHCKSRRNATFLDPSIQVLQITAKCYFFRPQYTNITKHGEMLLFQTLVYKYYKSRRNATFLDPSIQVLQITAKCYFFRPQYTSITNHGEMLLFWTLVVTLYEIVTRGVNSTRVESGFARFARSTTTRWRQCH